MNFKGQEMAALDLANLPKIIENFKQNNVEAIAICLLHSYSNQTHELKLRDEVKNLWPEVEVVISSDENPANAIMRSAIANKKINSAKTGRFGLG